MGCIFAFLSIISFSIFLLLYYIYLAGPPPIPHMDENEWWGLEELRGKQNDSIRPFRIEFKDDMIQDLRFRLRNTRPFTPPLEGVAFQYGFNTRELPRWLEYWAEEYNFTEREKFINKYPHYKTNIQGLDIHFIRIKPEVPPGVEVIPVLILHGWPGTVRELYEAIPHLTAVSEDRNFALELIAPNIPGFAYSDAAVRPGFGPPEMAVVMRNLMRRLGFNRFYIQAGDWGSVIASCMVTLYPKDILGFHTNMPVTATAKAPLIILLFSYFKTLLIDEALVDRVYPLTDYLSLLIEESGYFHLQATKPDTVGIAMSDSPAGLLAYVIEKFCAAVNPGYRILPDGGLSLHWTKDQLLDNLMLYWVPNSFTTSGRLYAESVNKRTLGMKWDDMPTDVPTWALQARHEIFYLPPSILSLKYKNLLGATVLHKGGHFLAWELPEEFSKDVLKAFGEFRRFWKAKKEL